jgi:hypothetical protein
MKARFKAVEFGTHSVEVIEGGYYDRYRMNPDLDAVAKDPAAGNIDYFRRIPKQLVASRVGPTWAPNFYYRTSSIQLLSSPLSTACAPRCRRRWNRCAPCPARDWWR